MAFFKVWSYPKSKVWKREFGKSTSSNKRGYTTFGLNFRKNIKKFYCLAIHKGQKEQKTSGQDPESATLADFGIAIGSKNMQNWSK